MVFFGPGEGVLTRPSASIFVNFSQGGGFTLGLFLSSLIFCDETVYKGQEDFVVTGSGLGTLDIDYLVEKARSSLLM